MVKITARRFLELLLPEILLSAIFSTMFVTGWVSSYAWLVILVCTLFLAGYFALQFIILRRTYKAVRNHQVYAFVNLLANVCFFTVNILCYECMSNTLYTWFFALLKTVHYFSHTGIGFSTALVHLFAVMLIFMAPFGVNTLEWDRMHRRTSAVKIWKKMKYKYLLKLVCLTVVLASFLMGCTGTPEGATQPDLPETEDTMTLQTESAVTGPEETEITATDPEPTEGQITQTSRPTDPEPTEGQTTQAPKPTDPEPTEEQTTATEPEDTTTEAPETQPETTQGGLNDGSSGDFSGGGGNIQWPT